MLPVAPHLLSDRLLQVSAGLTSRSCDEGVLVFDEKNGKTSLLNHQGALVLRVLCTDAGATEAMLQRALGMADESDRAAFETLLCSLDEAGFIARQ